MDIGRENTEGVFEDEAIANVDAADENETVVEEDFLDMSDVMSDVDLSAFSDDDDEDIEEESADDESIEELAVNDEDLDYIEAQEAAQEAQEASISDDTPEVVETTTEEAPSSAQKQSKQKRKAASVGKRIRTPVSDIDAGNFVMFDTDDPDDAKQALLNVRNNLNQRKVVEKLDNVIQARAGNGKPSVYVLECYRALKKNGSITTKTLASALMASTVKAGGYSQGTANAQAGQIMKLFPLLGITRRGSNGEQTLDPDSIFAQWLDTLV